MTTHQHTNPMEPTCTDILPLIPAYAFGATSPDETALVESLLADCPQAQAELEHYRAIHAEMHYTAPLVKAPGSVRSGLADRLSEITADAQQSTQAEPKPLIKLPEPTQTTPVSAPRRTRWAYVAAAAVVLLVISNVFWALRVDDMQRQEDELRLLLAQQPDNLAFLNIADVNITRLATTDADASAYTASLLWSTDSAAAVLYADGLPQIDTDQTFQLWLLRDDMRDDGGTFNVDVNGSGVLTIGAPLPIDDYAQFGITIEPVGGSEEPTTQPILAGTL